MRLWREESLSCLDPHRVSVMSVYITHTHRQLRQEQDWQDNYTKEQAKNIYVRALVYSTKTLIWSCLIDLPSPFRI